MFYTNVACVGENILYRGVTKEGKRVRQKIKYKPKLFVKSNKPSEWKTLLGEPLEQIDFQTIKDARDFVKKYEEVENFPIYGNTRYENALVSEMFQKNIPWDRSKLCVATLDVEVESENGFPEPEFANEKITAITMHVFGTYHVIGTKDFAPHRDDITYYKCEDEFELINKFIDLWTEYYPDLVTGWNIKYFDIPYIINRILRLFGEDKAKRLSPWLKIVEREDKFNKMGGKPRKYFIIYGVSAVDYLELYKKFIPKKQESYRLDYIASVDIGERKIDYSEYDSLHQLYKLDYQKFIEYNVKDVELVIRLDDKLGLLDLALTLAYNARVNYEDVFTQVRMWDSIISNKLMKRKIIIPPKRDIAKDNQYMGAYVKEPQIGQWNWVVSFDLNSLYPHLIMQFAISPENIVDVEDFNIDDFFAICKDPTALPDSGTHKTLDMLKKHNLCVAGNGAVFQRVSGFLPEIMEEMYNDRSKYKKKMIEMQKKREKTSDPEQKAAYDKDISRFNNLQLAMKVCLNSAYGTIGTPHFRFFDIRIAEAITLSGQMCIRWIIDRMNDYMNEILKTEGVDYVIASDTDSIYLNLGKVVETYIPNEKNKKKIINMLDRFCEDRLQKHIDKSFADLAEHLNAYSQKMIMKREVLADKGIWTAKKHYILNVYNSEGVEYTEPKIKTVGMEMVKSSTPGFFRDRLKSAVKIILNGTEEELVKYITKVREDMMNVPIADISFPRGTNDIGKWDNSETIYAKGTPIHVRGALVFNNLLESHHVTKRYEKIRDGDKIRFIYLKEPNPSRSNIIAFVNVIPEEFGVKQYIDYDTQFDKAFIKPLEIITNVIKWKTKEVSSLDAFFT